MKKISLAAVIIMALIGSLFAQDKTELKQGDELFAAFDYENALTHYAKALQENGNDYETLWRYSRALIDAGEMQNNDDTRKEYYFKAVELADQAMAVNPEGWEGYLYAAVSYGRKALSLGPKDRIAMSKQVKDLAEKAIELNPQCDIAYHILGRWNRKISNLNWFEKKAANLLFGGVPKGASMENALNFFKKAIEINPTYVNHYLELGITYKTMDNKEEAIKALEQAVSIETVSPKDKKYHEEAQKLLDSLK